MYMHTHTICKKKQVVGNILNKAELICMHTDAFKYY